MVDTVAPERADTVAPERIDTVAPESENIVASEHTVATLQRRVKHVGAFVDD
jgi:hypothetical protein